MNDVEEYDSRGTRSPPRSRSRSDSPPREQRERSRSRSRERSRERSRDRSPPAREDRDRSERRDEEVSNPGNNLYVRGISDRCSESDFERLFSKYGELTKVDICKEPSTGMYRGFGFVMYKNIEDADEAVRALDGYEFEGRRLIVEKARRSRPRSPTPGHYVGRKPFRFDRGGPPRREYGRDDRDRRDYGRRDYGGRDYDRRDDYRRDDYRRDDYRRDDYRRDDYRRDDRRRDDYRDDRRRDRSRDRRY